MLDVEETFYNSLGGQNLTGTALPPFHNKET